SSPPPVAEHQRRSGPDVAVPPIGADGKGASRENATIVSIILGKPVLWLLVAVPLPFIGQAIGLGHTAQFLLSVVAIVPLAGLLSTATESVAAKLGDAKGGLLNATLGNL